MYNLKPVCIVSYIRQAYFSNFEKNFRITFDTNVKIRNCDFNLKNKGGSKFIVPRTISIMEIKFNNFIPNWAVKIIQKNDCVHNKISKFAQGLEKTRIFSIV